MTSPTQRVTHPSDDPFLHSHVQAPNPTPGTAVAAIRAQLAAGPQLIPVCGRSNQPPPPANIAVGSDAVAALHAQADALRVPSTRAAPHRGAGVSEADSRINQPPPANIAVGSDTVAALRAQADALRVPSTRAAPWRIFRVIRYMYM